MTVAMQNGNGLQYLLTDHLGSIVAVTDASGTLTSQQRYLPFGEVRTDVGSIAETDLAYTGQRAVDGLGLLDYHARFYDSSIGRFISPDSIISDPANPQALNRYAYALGNPLRYNDPTGHRVCDDVDAMGNCITAPGSSSGSVGSGGNDSGDTDRDGGGHRDKKPDWGAAKEAGYSDLELQILQYLFNNGGSDAVHGVEYMLNNNIRIVTVSGLTGWVMSKLGRRAWFDSSNVYVIADQSTLLQDPWAVQNIIHEALHIEQGHTLSHSVEGERLAWQAGLRVYKTISPNSNIEFLPGSAYQNILDDTNPKDFADDIWNATYGNTMLYFYPMSPGDPCPNPFYCP